MIHRISSNSWWLFKDAVEHLLSSLYPVVAMSNKAVESGWAKYEYQKLDPQRPIEAFESWAGNVQRKKVAYDYFNLGWSCEQEAA